jgi:hypothetical protein
MVPCIEPLQQYLADSPPAFSIPKRTALDLSRPGIEEQWIASGTLRLSWQMNSKMKFSGTYERNIKHKGMSLQAWLSSPSIHPTAAQRRGGTPTTSPKASGRYT